MIDYNDLDSIRIARRHKCPICGEIYYIGKNEEQNAWECIVYTARHLYIAQCGRCGGLIAIKAKGEE